ncbi:MAG: hypothetical protein JNL24_00585 [Bacteroidia bacterium]|nr:hypothetical protein [Bacteroidia bacterium]
MKKINNHFSKFLFISLAGLIISSCGQDNPMKRNNTTDSALVAFQKGEKFIFTDSVQTYFITNSNKGTRIDISPNSFVFENGTSPVEDVVIEIKEFVSPADFIWSKLSMQGKNGLLKLGGAIYIEAKSGDKALKLREGKTIKISFPVGSDPQKMNLYTGTIKDGYIEWGHILDSIQPPPNINDTIILEGGIKGISFASKFDYYSFNSTEVGWLFCGYELKKENTTKLSLSIDTTIIPNTKILFNDIKTIGVPVYENGYLIFHNIPIGEKATLFGFYQEDGAKFFMYRKDVIVGNNMIENSIFKEVSLDQLKAEIETIKW